MILRGLLIVVGLALGAATGAIVAIAPANMHALTDLLEPLQEAAGLTFSPEEREQNIRDLTESCRKGYREDNDGQSPPPLLDNFCVCFATGATDKVSQLEWAATILSESLYESVVARVKGPCQAALEAAQNAQTK